MKNPEETSKCVVPEDELYESSSESEQETDIVKESESGLGVLNHGCVESERSLGASNLGSIKSERGLCALNLGGVQPGSGLGAPNLGGVESKCGPGAQNLGGVEEACRSSPQLVPTNLSLGAVPRKFTHSSVSSSSTLPVSPPSGFYMDPAPSAEVGMGGSCNMENFGKRAELLFPSTSTISSTLCGSSISSLRFYQHIVNSWCNCSLPLS